MPKSLFVSSLLLLAFAGCSSKPDLLSGKPRHRMPINHGLAIAPSPSPQIAKLVEANPTQRDLATYRYHFSFNKTDLVIPHRDAELLLRDALEAPTVLIRGRTDGLSYSRGDEHVAQGRANAALDYLVSRGIDASKIHIDALSGGDYIAPNSTPAGRALNRRVEIQPRW